LHTESAKKNAKEISKYLIKIWFAENKPNSDIFNVFLNLSGD